MPVIIKWLTPASLIRAGGCEYGNGDFLSQTITGATQVQVELDPVYPAAGVGSSPSPQVTITAVATGSQGNPNNFSTLGAGPVKTLQFNIGDNGAEQAGGLNRLDITATGDESFMVDGQKLLAQSCTLRVYYYRAPNPTTTTTTTPAPTTTTTTTTPAPTTTTTTTTPAPTTSTTTTPGHTTTAGPAASKPVRKRAKAY